MALYEFSSESFFENMGIKYWIGKFIKNKSAIKDGAMEVSSTMATLVPAYNQENRKILFDEITKYQRGGIDKRQIDGILKAGFILLPCLRNEEQDQLMNVLLDTQCGVVNNQPLSDTQYDVYHGIINYIVSKRCDTVRQLLKKAARKFHKDNNSISIALVKFLETIDDAQLIDIKEWMRYIVKDLHCVIIGVNRRNSNAGEHCLFHMDEGSYYAAAPQLMKEYSSGMAMGGKLSNDILIYGHNVKSGTQITVTFELNKLGMELYNLLEDELEPCPETHITQLFQQ